MRLVYALPFVAFASAAMAQAPMQAPPSTEEQLSECSSQLAIRQDYLAQDEHSIIVLRSAITKMQNEVAMLRKMIEEQKKKETPAAAAAPPSTPPAAAQPEAPPVNK